MLENKYVLLGAGAAGGILVGGLATGYVASRRTKKTLEEVDASLDKMENIAKEAIKGKVLAEGKLKSAEKREEALRTSLGEVISKTSKFTDNLRKDFKNDAEASEILANRVDEFASELDALADEWE